MKTKQMNHRQGDSPATSRKETRIPATNGRMPYLPPQLEVIQIENEGVIALSNFDGANAFSTTGYGYRYLDDTTPYNSASSSDLDDLINDILTIEQ